LEEFFEIGRVVKPHGLRGHLKVRSYLTEPEKVLSRVREVILTRKEERLGPFILGEWRRQGDFIVIEIGEVKHIDEAQTLVGCLVWARMECLEPLPEGEYYWCELLGMEVVTEAGEVLGKITSIIPTGSNDVYVCTSEKGELLIPATYDCVQRVDRRERKMIVHFLKGLSWQS